jgi:hypothetical protein
MIVCNGSHVDWVDRNFYFLGLIAKTVILEENDNGQVDTDGDGVWIRGIMAVLFYMLFCVIVFSFSEVEIGGCWDQMSRHWCSCECFVVPRFTSFEFIAWGLRCGGGVMGLGCLLWVGCARMDLLSGIGVEASGHVRRKRRWVVLMDGLRWRQIRGSEYHG